MSGWTFLWLVWSIATMMKFQVCIGSDVRLPPSIIEEPEEEYIFRVGERVELRCVATGTPIPEYKWYKNGNVLDLRNGVSIEMGTLIIKKTQSSDEGYYFCFAENPYGVAMTKTTWLLKATLQEAPLVYTPKQYYAAVGSAITITCNPIHSVPKGRYHWFIAHSGQSKPIELDERVHRDPSGNLYFANILETDSREGRIYTCVVANEKLRSLSRGSDSILNTSGGGDASHAPPLTGMYKTPSPLLALVGESMELQCIFSGLPTPNITWRRRVGSLPAERFVRRSQGSKLVVMSVTEEDEDVYICTATNGRSLTEQAISVQVGAKPMFRSKGADIQPLDMNKTEGEDATFNCKPYAIPVAEVQWLMNGETLNPDSLPERMMISEDGTSLTVENLCKDCTTGGRNSDLMVIQCNSSNIHGYVLGAGYLNVLFRTAFTATSPPKLQIEAEKILQLPCEGKTDDSTPLEYQWRFEDAMFVPEAPYTRILVNNTLEINTYGLQGDDLKTYAGKYTCIITNGYTSNKMDTLVTGPKNLPSTGKFNSILIITLAALVVVLFFSLVAACIFIQKRIVLRKEAKEEVELDSAQSKEHEAPISSSNVSRLNSAISEHSDLYQEIDGHPPNSENQSSLAQTSDEARDLYTTPTHVRPNSESVSTYTALVHNEYLTFDAFKSE